MKKIMVHAITKLNLGDDIFLKILFNRYPNTKFKLILPGIYKNNYKYKNVDTISDSSLSFRIKNKILKTLNKDFSLQRLIARKCDASVFIGGSIFQQTLNWRRQIKKREKLLVENQPFYILGANFGTFSDLNYKLEYNPLFLKMEDICFRDLYSYNLFRDLNNVRYADDIVFTLYNVKKPESKYSGNKYIVVSVIQPSHRSYLDGLDDLYYKKIRDMCLELISKGFDIILMSFCKAEGDENAIQEILELIPENYCNNIKSYYYEGDIKESLTIINNSKGIIATRFHAMILGWVYKKPTVPIAYNKKMLNVMEDIEFRGKWIDFNNLENIEVDDFVNQLYQEIPNVKLQANNAAKHFRYLDKFLNH